MGFSVLARNAVVIGCVAMLIRLVTIPAGPIPINVRWADGVDAGARHAFESQLGLTGARLIEGATWSYTAADSSRRSLRAITDHHAVADTHGIDRASARPADRPDPGIVEYLAVGVAAGIAGAAVLAFAATRRRARLSPRVLAAAAGAAPAAVIGAVAIALAFAAGGFGPFRAGDDVSLVHAAYEADIATMARHVAAGADLDAPAAIDGRLMTPIEAAIRSGDVRAVRVLLDSGMSLDAPTRDGLSAIAVEMEAVDIAALIRQHPPR